MLYSSNGITSKKGYGIRMFDVNIISTGSKGNCVIIDGHFMLDAGVTKKLVSKSEHNGEEFDWNNLKTPQNVIIVAEKPNKEASKEQSILFCYYSEIGGGKEGI